MSPRLHEKPPKPGKKSHHGEEDKRNSIDRYEKIIKDGSQPV